MSHKLIAFAVVPFFFAGTTHAELSEANFPRKDMAVFCPKNNLEVDRTIKDTFCKFFSWAVKTRQESSEENS